MNQTKTTKLTISALLLAVGMLLPFLTGQIPQIGNKLLPMHLPVLLCGFWCGWQYGAVMGFVLPLLRSVVFGVPVMVPMAAAMACEMAVYGLVTGFLYEKLPKKRSSVYVSLIAAMLCGRVVWGIVSVPLYGMAGKSFAWSIFMANGFVNAVPGMIIQLILVPLLVGRIRMAQGNPVSEKTEVPDGIETAENTETTENTGIVEKNDRMEKNTMNTNYAIKDKIKADIDQLLLAGNPSILVAIDGNSASGKTTLAGELAKLYDCNVIHMDEFFLQPAQQTKERYAQPGGNVDYERFQTEVLEPLKSGKAFDYRVYDCGVRKLTKTVHVEPKQVTILEGAYSRHPYFGEAYDLTYWMIIRPDEQKRRILVRNGAAGLKRFTERWIPLENAYLDDRRPAEWTAICEELEKTNA